MIKIDASLLEQIKDLSYSISNCIPVIGDEDINYFRPEDQLELLEALKRVHEYCKEI